MAFCTQCGAPIDDKAVICPSCGAQQASSAANAGTSNNFNANANNNPGANFVPPPSSGNVMGDDFTQQFDPNDIQQNKVLSIFAYIGILFLIPLLAAPNSQFSRFHANQGLVLFLADIAFGIVIGVLTVILIWIPVFGSIVVGLISAVVYIGLLILMVLGIVNAATGKAKELPLIGKIKIIK